MKASKARWSFSPEQLLEVCRNDSYFQWHPKMDPLKFHYIVIKCGQKVWSFFATCCTFASWQCPETLLCWLLSGGAPGGKWKTQRETSGESMDHGSSHGTLAGHLERDFLMVGDQEFWWHWWHRVCVGPCGWLQVDFLAWPTWDTIYTILSILKQISKTHVKSCTFIYVHIIHIFPVS